MDVQAGRRVIREVIANWELVVDTAICDGQDESELIVREKAFAGNFAAFFKSAHRATQEILGEGFKGYQLKLMLVAPVYWLDETWHQFNSHSVEHVYFVKLPASDRYVKDRVMLDFMGILHEYFHAAIKTSGREFPNEVSEEAAAYIFHWYLLSTVYDQHDRLKVSFSYGRESIRPEQPLPVDKGRERVSSLRDSEIGGLWAKRSIVYVLGVNALELGNLAHQQKLAALCRRMIRQRLDVTRPQDFSDIANMQTEKSGSGL